MLLCAKGKILLKNDKTDFTQGRILPKLAFFMLPILGALVLQAAYGAVDLLVVGRFGSTSGLSAVSTGSQVLNLVTFVVTQLAMGITVLIARYLGEKRPQYIGQVIGGAAIVFTLLAAALFVVLVFFARLISSLMQAPAEALDLTASYVRICGSGIFFIVAYNMDASVIANSYAYLMGFAPETIATAILFSMVGYFNGNDKTLWVMVQGLVQTLLVRLPMAYIMSIQPNASLTMIGLSAPTSTAVGILLNISFFLWLKRYENQTCA